MATDQGTDFSCVTDLNATLTEVRGRPGLLQAVARRLITPSGGLLGSSEYGYDVRQWINASHPRDLASISAAVAEEAQKDERVVSATADATFDEDTETMTVEFALVDEDGPFSATISIDDVTVDLLLEGTELT